MFHVRERSLPFLHIGSMEITFTVPLTVFCNLHGSKQ